MERKNTIMDYSIFELLFFLFIYSFLGWCLEVLYMAVQTGRFCNRGVLNLPLSLSYGIAAVLLILIQPTLREHWLFQPVAYMVIASAVAQLASEVSYRLTGKKLWNQDEKSVYAGRVKGFLYMAAAAVCAMLVILLVHPFLYLAVHALPDLLIQIVSGVLLVLVLIDASAVYLASRKKLQAGRVRTLAAGLQVQKKTVGSRLTAHIWNRLKKAYPKLQAAEDGEEENRKNYVFAKGICLDKVFWIFVITAVAGVVIETVFVGVTTGRWMSRASLLYGPFSIVWGAGGALLTVLLHKLSSKDDRYIFLGGFFLGGTYEYMCSVISEVFFGTVFWDYSDMPFNIGGRTNLLFCIFWGILALVWVKIIYPKLSGLIERIPPMTGKIVTWVCMVLMACDLAISGMALLRYVERKEGIPARNIVEEYVDYQCPDEYVEVIWPNMRMR
mgnify:FL=1